MTLSATERLAGLNNPAVALSPDGTHLVYVASRGGSQQQLYLRAMDSLEAEPIGGTEGAEDPFFSPDGQWVGFWARGQLKKVSISGGATLTLADGRNSRGTSWGPNETIVFAPIAREGLWQVSAAGGAPQELTTLKEGETSHRWPQLLPDGKTVLFTVGIGGSYGDAHIAVQRLEEGEHRVLIRGGTFARHVPTGHLVFYRAGTMMAVLFDPVRLEVTGMPAPVLEGIQSSPNNRGVGHFSLSHLGTLVYVPGGASEGGSSSLVWVDREGAVEPLGAPPHAYRGPRLSPDGQRLAVEIAGTKRDIWVYDIARQTLTRLTFEGENQQPQWTPDGKRVTWRSIRDGVPGNLFWKLADGTGAVERLTTSEFRQQPGSWSPDGQLLAFHHQPSV